MADGITLNVENASLNVTHLEGVGLSSASKDDDKKLFKKDNQSELLEALKNLPESFRTVLSQTMESTGQSLFKGLFGEDSKDDDEPKAHFEKPSEKENDVKKLAAKYGTPALYLGSKIDDIIEFYLPFENSLRNLVVIKKVSITPKQYPRKMDKIKKKH